MNTPETYVCIYCDKIITTGAVCLPCDEIDGAMPVDEYLDQIREDAATMSLTDLVKRYAAAVVDEMTLMNAGCETDEYDLVADRACVLVDVLRARLSAVDAAAVTS